MIQQQKQQTSNFTTYWFYKYAAIIYDLRWYLVVYWRSYWGQKYKIITNMKGQLSVDPTFKPVGIHRPSIYSTNPLVAFDGHRLHLGKHNIPWQLKNIVNCAYHPSLNVLMLLCSDWKLYIFNRKLSDWESKYSVGFEYVPNLNIFILVGVIQVEVMKVAIRTNIKQTKFLSSVRFNVERQQLKTVSPSERLTWNKGYGYDLEENLLYVWSTQDINFFSLNKLELKSKVERLVKKEQALTYVHLNRSYKYTITGLINGNVRVWRLPLRQINSSAQYIMIHNCIYHAKAVQNIVPAQDERIILTAAEDRTVCMWSLETFQLLRAYNFEVAYSKLFLVDYRRAYAIHGGQLGELTFGKTMEFILQIDSNLAHVDKLYQNDRVTSFQLTLESNVGLQILGKDLSSKDLNKIDIAYFYPPLKAQYIRQVLSSPYDSSLYYMLVENGELFSLTIANNSSKIQQSFALQHTLDSENHPLNQTPTFIAFLALNDIQYDSEITENSFSKTNTPRQTSEYKKLKLMTVGCSRGSIVILSIDNVERMRTRLTYHRESIVAIQSIFSERTGKYILASKCAEDYLRFCELQVDRAHCFLTINCGHSLKFIRSFQDHLALVFTRGIFQMAHVYSQQNMNIWQNLDAIDHEGQIISIDYDCAHRLVMTGGSDNRIKVWSRAKVLLFEIKLDEGLKHAFWSNDLEIFVCHRSKLLYLKDSLRREDLQEQEVDFEQDRRFLSVGIREYFQQFKSNVMRDREQGMEDSQFIKNKPRAVSQGQNKTIVAASKPQNVVKQLQIAKNSIKKKEKAKSRSKGENSYIASLREDQEKRKRQQIQANLKATKKHIEQINNIKRSTNESLLPKIQPRNEDKFQQFINAKLISKKMLTRRDITLNRIIMKNLIKQQFSQQDELSSLKLDF